MSKRKMTYLVIAVIVLAVGWFGWKLTSRSGYESAPYKTLESDGSFALREYPDLMLVTTPSKFDTQGNDGSFGRLFKYIRGGNEEASEVSMTTPVFMQPESDGSGGQMGFVLPAKVAEGSIPTPSADDVQIEKRRGGKFAVLRFSGRMNAQTKTDTEKRLREWIKSKNLLPSSSARGIEFAGYDPPLTPGPFRRNEVLIAVE